MVNLYSVLGVDRSATNAEIGRAFRTIAAANHPDRFPGDASKEQKFKEASAAFHVLSDPEKRSAHDRLLDAENKKTTSAKTSQTVGQSHQRQEIGMEEFLRSALGSEFFGAVAERVTNATQDQRKRNVIGGAATASRLFVENRRPSRNEVDRLLDGGLAFADLMESLINGSSGGRGDGT